MKLTKILRTAAVSLLCALTLTSCSSRAAVDISETAPKSEYPFTVNGVTITEAVEKVAIFDDSLADVVMFLGSASQLKLAARAEDVMHPEVDVLPTAGTSQDPDVEKLSQIGVKMIITDEAFAEDVQKELDRAKIQVLVCEPAANRTELTELYRSVACVLLGGKTGYDTGAKRADSLLMAMDDILRIIPDSDVPVVTGFVLDETGTFATDLTMTGSMLSYAKVVNLAADQAEFTADELEIAAPSMLFCAFGLKDPIESNALFTGLTAVKKGKVIELARGELIWQGERMINGLLRIVTTLYPDLDAEGLLPDIEEDPAPNTSSKPEDTTSSTPSSPSGSYPTSVSESSSKADIKILQDRLIELGYLPPPSNGIYSYWTRACVKDFQKKAGLPQTGTADAKTMNALFAADAPRF